jgi:hydroxyacylglutathione hydrolase
MLSYIHAIEALQDNYIWAIVQPPYCLLVDPGEAEPAQAFLDAKQLTLCGIFITHHHHDHTGGLSTLTETHNIPVWGPATEDIPQVTHPLSGGSNIVLPELGTRYEIVALPGHTRGHIGYYDGLNLFCGDTLFAAGMGKLFEGTPQQMLQSIQRIEALPRDTWIYPAHEYTVDNLYFAQQVEPDNQAITQRMEAISALRAHDQPSLPTTLAQEYATNPFLRYRKCSVQKAVQSYLSTDSVDNLATFTGLRHWKDNFTR